MADRIGRHRLKLPRLSLDIRCIKLMLGSLVGGEGFEPPTPTV
jgi:hypothetical protein